MAFNGLPAIFPDKVQNTEAYVQKRIYSACKFLTMFPIEQNETGLFTNYLNGEIEVGDPQYTNNGINFNEIKFGQGQTVGGQTLPIGFMYKANTRDEQRGKYESNLLSFYNSAVVKIADFFEDKYASQRSRRLSLAPFLRCHFGSSTKWIPKSLVSAWFRSFVFSTAKQL